MVATHTVRLPLVPRRMHAYVVLGLAAHLWIVGATRAATVASHAGSGLPPGPTAVHFQAPPVPASGSTTELAFRPGETVAPAIVQPARDPFEGRAVGQTQFISPGEPPELPADAGDKGQQPQPICDAAREKPPGQLTIDISTPAGLVPRDHAAQCWPEIAGATGANPLVRCWPQYCYHWRATCLAYQPLYFEEINLERHGYGLGDIVQPWVSGAHFFGTVPCLPYLMAVDPPRECIYTLGHYRPGSCPPWQHNWPPLSIAGGLSEAGVITGLIFLIP